jgi:AhpD family alkylhydroperoxidase
LIKLRASQLNGCAYCLNMHAREARKAEVDQVKVDVLAGWKEAVLCLQLTVSRRLCGMTEEVTHIADGVSDETWEGRLCSLLRTGDGRAAHGDLSDQRLEPPRCEHPPAPWTDSRQSLGGWLMVGPQRRNHSCVPTPLCLHRGLGTPAWFRRCTRF